MPVRIPNLYLDCDGVLADFNAHVFNSFGHGPRDVSDPELWDKIHGNDSFWLDIPRHFGSQELFDYSKNFNTTIITGCPKTNFDLVAEHKREWIKQHFGDVPVITCLSRDKQFHMKEKGDVLVDDFIVNINRWEKAGGLTVYYRDPVKDLRRLKGLMNRLTGIDYETTV